MIGALVRSRREAQGWSQERLERETGIRQSYISKIERGDVEIPQRHNLEKIGAALGISLPDFYRAAGVLDLPDGVGGDATFQELVEMLEARPGLAETLRAMRGRYSPETYRRIMAGVIDAWESNLKMARQQLAVGSELVTAAETPKRE